MSMPRSSRLRWIALLALTGFGLGFAEAAPANGRLLYVAGPGIRNYLEYGDAR